MFMLFFQRALIISIFIGFLIMFISIGNNNSNNMETIDTYTFMIYDTDYTKYGTAYQVQYLDKKYIITNQHVCGASDKMIVQSDKLSPEQVNVILMNIESDLCVLSPVKLTGGLRLSSNIPLYQHVQYFGYPRQTKTYDSGILQNKETTSMMKYKVTQDIDYITCVAEKGYIVMDEFMDLFCMSNANSYTITVPIFFGASGSPVLYNGYVIGTVFGFKEGKTLFTESEKLINLLQTIKD